MQFLDRRRFVGGCLSLVSFGSAGFADSHIVPRHCGGIFSTLEDARSAYNSSGQWAISVAPEAIERLKRNSAAARQAIGTAKDTLDDTNVNFALDATNALAAGLIFTLGVTGAVAASPLYISAIITSGVFLTARFALVPTHVKIEGFAVSRGLEHLDGILSHAGSNSATLSHNLGTYSAAGAKLTGALNLLIQGWGAYQSYLDVSEKRRVLSQLQEAAAETSSALDQLNSIERLSAFRGACARGLGEDLDKVYAIQCIGSGGLD